MRLSHIPLRVTTGAYILNSGLGKLEADDAAAKGLHGMASGAYPMVEEVEPRTFAKTLAIGEIAIGGALLMPLVSSFMAGAALTGFSVALVGMYLKTPGMTQEDSVRPTQQGIPYAKDIWMVGTGLALMIDGMTPSASKRRAARKAARAPMIKAAEGRAAAKGYARGLTTSARAGKGIARATKRGAGFGGKKAAKGWARNLTH